MSVSVCDIVAAPANFAGKIVKLEGPIIISRVYEAVAGPDTCHGSELFLGETESKQEDALMEHFDEADAAQFVPLKPNRDACMYNSCPEYAVTAEMVGRIDYPVSELGQTAPRFELMQVLQVWSHENSFDAKVYREP